MDDFFDGYVAAALWSSTDDNGNRLEDRYGPEHIAPETLERMRADCRRFYDANKADIDAGTDTELRDSTDAEYAGNDFWLTRNRHGAGFWDGGWPEDAGERLTSAAKQFGESDLYIGDDGLIYAFPNR